MSIHFVKLNMPHFPNPCVQMATDSKHADKHALIIEELGNPVVVTAIVESTPLLNVLAKIIVEYGSNGCAIPMRQVKNVTSDCCAVISVTDIKWDQITIGWKNPEKGPHVEDDTHSSGRTPCIVLIVDEGDVYPYYDIGHPSSCPHNGAYICNTDSRVYRCSICSLPRTLWVTDRLSLPINAWGWTGIISSAQRSSTEPIKDAE